MSSVGIYGTYPMQESSAESSMNPVDEKQATEESAKALGEHPEITLSKDYTAAFADIPVRAPSGGDFHNAFEINDGTGDVALLIGDVSGHGPEQTGQADLMREMVSDCLAIGMTPAKTLDAVNAAVEIDPRLEDFSTVFAGRIEKDTGKMVYASGGHEPALLVPPNASKTEDIQDLNCTGMPVGAFPPEIAKYEDRIETIPNGGMVLLYTDGIPDAYKPEDRSSWFGLGRLRSLIATLSGLPPGKIITELLKRVMTFCNGRLRDDIAVMAVKRDTHSSSEHTLSE